MKKKFLILITIYGFFLVVGATVVIFNIDLAISNLDELVERYQKERNCTKVLMAIKKVQQDGFLHHTYGDTDMMEMDQRIANMDQIVSTCTSCHHPPPIAQKIESFTRQTTEFKEALTTIFAHTEKPRHETVDLKAFSMGQELYAYAQSLFNKSSKQLATETQVVRSLTVKSKGFIYVIVLGGLLIMMLISFLLMRCFTKPLQSLLTATEKIQQGDLDSRVSGLKHEFGTLAASFNNMSASLQTQMKQLQRSEQLATCGKIATTLVHEVKNPLAGIKIAMDVLADESSVSKEDQKILDQVVKEVNRIDNLLSSMLEFARPKPAQFANVNLNDVIERGLHFTPGVIKKEILIDWDRNIQPPDIRIDPNQLNQVLLNLFINAEAAMPDGGTIFITVSWTDKDVQLCVADNGPGIDQATLDEIFSPFFTTKAKGSGLGLTTCRTLINLNHGTITGANRPEGGAIFTITLPIAEDVKP
jgi:signal transduction histidine kinase